MVWQQVGTASGPQGNSFSGGGANGGPGAPGLLPQMQARLAAAEAELQQKLREAREVGRREGEAAGRQAAYAEVQPVVERLSAAIEQIADLRPKLRMQAESDLVRLAVAIARRIVNRELNTDTEAITGLIRVGLEKLRLQEVTRVRMHPEYQAVIKELLARSGSAAHVEVSGDATLERGAAIFETSRGDLDMSVETQLREIERGLTDRLRSQGQ
jgi:flagellar assembly protein FliH